MDSKIVLILLLPAIALAQQTGDPQFCNNEQVSICMTNFTKGLSDALTNSWDVCMPRQKFMDCAWYLPGCNQVVVQLITSIEASVDFSNCSSGMPSPTTMAKTIYRPSTQTVQPWPTTSKPWRTTADMWRTTGNPWMTTAMHMGDCGYDVQVCMKELQQMTPEAWNNPEWVCPEADRTIKCLNKLHSCAGTWQFHDARKMIEERAPEYLCPYISRFPMTGGGPSLQGFTSMTLLAVVLRYTLA